jgi:hypothetical protein
MDKCYIEYLNASKNFQRDIIYFEGENAYEDAVAWGQTNLENFIRDMIKYA